MPDFQKALTEESAQRNETRLYGEREAEGGLTVPGASEGQRGWIILAIGPRPCLQPDSARLRLPGGFVLVG